MKEETKAHTLVHTHKHTHWSCECQGLLWSNKKKKKKRVCVCVCVQWARVGQVLLVALHGFHSFDFGFPPSTTTMTTMMWMKSLDVSDCKIRVHVVEKTEYGSMESGALDSMVWNSRVCE